MSPRSVNNIHAPHNNTKPLQYRGANEEADKLTENPVPAADEPSLTQVMQIENKQVKNKNPQSPSTDQI